MGSQMNYDPQRQVVANQTLQRTALALAARRAAERQRYGARSVK